MFNEWCAQEGVIMPAVEYPAYFEGGLLGMKCTQDVGHHEAYICIPVKMIMSVNKAKVHPVLSKIVDDNPQCFAAEGSDDWEQLTLVLFMFYELTLGEKSYWLPYLRLMPDVHFISSWTPEELAALDHDELASEVEALEADLETTWSQFEALLKKYPAIFPSRFVNKALFLNAFAQVCSRCFGYGLPSCSLLPMADNQNHNCIDINVEMVNVKEHFKDDKESDYYRFSKFTGNYSSLFKSLDLNFNSPKVKGLFNKDVFDAN